jgi:hypothetical protein
MKILEMKGKLDVMNRVVDNRCLKVGNFFELNLTIRRNAFLTIELMIRISYN